MRGKGGCGLIMRELKDMDACGVLRVAMDTLVRIHPEVWGRRSSRTVPVAAQHCSRIYKGDLVAGLRGAQLSSIAQCKFEGRGPGEGAIGYEIDRFAMDDATKDGLDGVRREPGTRGDGAVNSLLMLTKWQ